MQPHSCFLPSRASFGACPVWLLLVMTLVAGPAFAQLPPTPGKGQKSGEFPKQYIPQRIVDLGTVMQGGKLRVAWVIENRGGGELVIHETRASCGCTLVQLDEEDKLVAPGESMTLEATFNSEGRRGRQRKIVTVRTNDPIEPEVKLEFVATVEVEFEMDPDKILRIGELRRGESGTRGLEIKPGRQDGTVEILDVEFEGAAPLTYEISALEQSDVTGQRVDFAVADDAPLGPISARAIIKVNADGKEVERSITISGNVVGELTQSHVMIDQTRHKLNPGQRLKPVTIRSLNGTPFEIISAEADAFLDVAVEDGPRRTPKVDYVIRATIRDDAPPGPFGVNIYVRTDSIDQPLITIPTFGNIVPPVQFEPELVLLRDDGTRMGPQRRLKILGSPREELNLSAITCDLPGVVARIDQRASAPFKHMAYVDVRFEGKLPKGTHESVLRVMTGVPGSEAVEIPLTVIVP